MSDNSKNMSMELNNKLYNDLMSLKEKYERLKSLAESNERVIKVLSNAIRNNKQTLENEIEFILNNPPLKKVGEVVRGMKVTKIQVKERTVDMDIKIREYNYHLQKVDFISITSELTQEEMKRFIEIK